VWRTIQIEQTTPSKEFIMNIAPLEHVAVGDPITRNGVSLIPVYIHQHTQPISTGVAAAITIKERTDASVPTLQVVNLGNTPVLLLEGETVNGGLQDRVLNVSVLVPANDTIEIPVSCVEQGRWNGGGEFRQSRTLAPRRVRRTKTYSVARAVHESGVKRSDQGAVWSAVHTELTRLNARNDTSTLAAADGALLRDGRLIEAVDALVATGPLPGQSGVVVSHGSRIVAADVFAGPDMLACHWEAIVRSNMLDAPERVQGRPSLTRVARFMRKFATTTNTIASGVGLGREHHVTNTKVAGQALVWDDTLVHASAFALAV
jgi:hypothetical protein